MRLSRTPATTARRLLGIVTLVYLLWSLAPVLVSLAASMGLGPAAETGASVGLDAYRSAMRDEALRSAFLHSAVVALVAVGVGVSLGTTLGVALSHLRSIRWQPLRVSILIGIVVPHLALAVAIFYLFAFVVRAHLGTGAQMLAHITIVIPFTTLIVWTRVLLLDPSYEEQAADLGASPPAAIRRVLLPLCAPAIVVASAVAFAISFNEMPLSDRLCIANDCVTLPMIVGAPRGGDVTDTAFALATMAMTVGIAILLAGVVVVGASRRWRASPRPSSGVARTPW